MIAETAARLEQVSAEAGDESLSREWNRVATPWIEGRRQRSWRRHSDSINCALIERWLPSTHCASILKTDLFDEAVNAGIVPHLLPRCERVAAIDVSGSVVAAAQAKYPFIEALRADVRTLPFDSGSFDVVVSISTLDHFDDSRDITQALRQLFRVLKPGGTLILTIDNAANPVVALRNRLPYSFTHRLGLVPYPVGKTLTPNAAKAAVTSAGFEIQEHTTVMHAPRVFAIPLLSRLDRSGLNTLAGSLLRSMRKLEILGQLPTRSLTGHFVAIRAIKAFRLEAASPRE